MSNPFNVAAVLAIGASLALQPPINAAMARVLGSPLLAASISIAISFIVVVLFWLTWGKAAGDLGQLRALPWWVTLGGVIGFCFVVAGVLIAPTLGVGLFFVCVVAGQLVGSILTDHFGAFGLPVKPINLMKLLGLGLVLAGTALVRNSDG